MIKKNGVGEWSEFATEDVTAAMEGLRNGHAVRFGDKRKKSDSWERKNLKGRFRYKVLIAFMPGVLDEKILN